MLQHELIPAAETDSRRLMVVLHGLGDSREGYRWLPPTLGLPWLNYLLVDAPDDYYGGFSWFEFPGDPGPGARRSRALLFELLDDLPRRGFPADQTVLFGFSQGCLMTVDVGFRYPHRLAGLIGISGWVHEPETLLRELSPVGRDQRLLATHGTQDPLLPFAQAKRLYAELRSAGLQVDWHEFDKVHTIDEHRELGIIRQFLVDRLKPAGV